VLHQRNRLCRLMCGKPLAFRRSLLFEFGLCPVLRAKSESSSDVGEPSDSGGGIDGRAGKRFDVRVFEFDYNPCSRVTGTRRVLPDRSP
jgi:hypothetical protein